MNNRAPKKPGARRMMPTEFDWEVERVIGQEKLKMPDGSIKEMVRVKWMNYRCDLEDVSDVSALLSIVVIKYHGAGKWLVEAFAVDAETSQCVTKRVLIPTDAMQEHFATELLKFYVGHYAQQYAFNNSSEVLAVNKPGREASAKYDVPVGPVEQTAHTPVLEKPSPDSSSSGLAEVECASAEKDQECQVTVKAASENGENADPVTTLHEDDLFSDEEETGKSPVKTGEIAKDKNPTKRKPRIVFKGL